MSGHAGGGNRETGRLPIEGTTLAKIEGAESPGTRSLPIRHDRQRSDQENSLPLGHSARLQQALDQIERETVDLDHERMSVFTPVGDLVMEVDGDHDSILISGDRAMLLQGNIVTHNHSLFDQSLSLIDVQTAITYGTSEERAVSAQYRYSIQPAPGVIWDHNLWNNLVRPSYHIHIVEVFTELLPRVSNGELTLDQANMLCFHEVWTRVAQETGAFIYTRESWNPATSEE